MKAEPEVIATLTRGGGLSALMAAVVMTAASGLILWLAVVDTRDFFSHRYSVGGVIASLVYFLGFVPYAIWMLWRYYHRGGRQIWVEDGRLMFYGTDEVSCAEVTALSLTHGVMWLPQIQISMKNGTEQKIYVQGQSIPPDAILKRLREICGLPDSAVEIPPSS